MKRLNALLTAYACEPGQGSEPGIGWNIVREVAKYHNLTVITRPNNRASIVEALEHNPIDGLSFVYYDPPRWATWWKKGTRGLFLYYYWWQFGAYRVARKLTSEYTFDLTHHVTFGRYWSPSFLYRLGLPVVWGPVGGGESTPSELLETLPKSGRLYERVRGILRGLGEWDPFVRKMARKSSSIFATTDESKQRLAALGGNNISIIGNAALDEAEIDDLNQMSMSGNEAPIFASIGRLLHWKGFHLGLEAFAKAAIPGSEYWVIGDGPAEAFLKERCSALGIKDKVKFLGKLQRMETLEALQGVDSLVHPSFHDSGGWVCIESMAAGRPVISLDLGGPGLMVNDQTGFKIAPGDPERVVEDLSQAMKKMANTEARSNLAKQAKKRARALFTWQVKGSQIADEYNRICGIEARSESNSQLEVLHS